MNYGPNALNYSVLLQHNKFLTFDINSRSSKMYARVINKFYPEVVKTIFSIFTCLLILSSFGQAVDHFNESSARWHVAHSRPETTPEFPNFVTTTTNIWGFSGDTLMGGHVWLKLYTSTDTLFTEGYQFRGYIRSDQDLVIFMNAALQPDTLYDFSLEIGSHVVYEVDEFSSVELELIMIDLVEVSGELRKRFVFSTAWITFENSVFDIWIEGIGSIQGPLQPNNPVLSSFADSTRVTCTYASGEVSWQNPSYTVCNPNIVLTSTNYWVKEISAFPNPFGNNFIVTNNFHHPVELAVYNTLGQQVRRLQCPPGQNEVDLSEVVNGLYFLNIMHGSTSITKKMLKIK